MRKAKKIEIVDATVEDWYYEMKGLGCIFEVAEEFKDAYGICIGGVSDCFIVEKENVKVIEWIEPSYRERQAEWIKKNGFKIGDKVRFMHHFNPSENGFLPYGNQGNFVFPLGTICTLDIIAKDYIGLKETPHPMPYFAFEPVVDMWQPCETVEEKLLFIGRKVRRKNDGAKVELITGVYNSGFRLGNDGMEYASNKELLDNYELLDGSPIGVNKLKELLE